MIARVLLVGCSAVPGGRIADRLRSGGYIVQESGHAAEALEILESGVDAVRPVELVVVDEKLTGVDARLFAALVREDRRLSSARLVLLAHDVEADFEPFVTAGYAGQVGPSVDAASLSDFLGTPLPTVDYPRQDPAPVGAAATGLILLVEDNEINMEVAREMIGKAGYRCDHAANGHEAVEAIQRGRYDLVLMDCQMPKMDGYEATRRIRAWEDESGAGRRVPIVAVTAHAMTGDRERCLDAGMDDYLTKPVESSRLVATIAKWLSAS